MRDKQKESKNVDKDLGEEVQNERQKKEEQFMKEEEVKRQRDMEAKRQKYFDK